jgi:hypothetical protein
MPDAISSISNNYQSGLYQSGRSDNAAGGRQVAQKTEQNQSSTGTNKQDKSKAAGSNTNEKNPVTGLDKKQEQAVSELQSRDREVRAHEQAHIAAGGNLVRGGATFSYETGPDGKRYAIGGEVNIDTSPVQDDPSATIRKAYRVRAAALAPASPSGQDQAVASAAMSMAAQAQMELAKQAYQKTSGASGGSGSTTQKSA